MSFRVPLDRRHGGAGVKADDCAWMQQRVTLRSAPVLPAEKWFAIQRYVPEDRGYSTPCWIWAGATNKGYGFLHLQRQGRRYHLQAHRVFYERLVGPIPDGLEIDHLCRVPACVNPAHLEPVTTAENQRRGRGARLTVADVVAIRSSSASKSELARQFGVSHRHIGRVQNGEKWKVI